MTKYPMVEHEAFIAAMEQLIQDYEAERGTDICILCKTAMKVTSGVARYCHVCPWQTITSDWCLSKTYYEPKMLYASIIGYARLYPEDYPTTVAIRIADLHEWIELYRADLAKQ